MKKILIISVICICLCGCGNDNQNKTNNNNTENNSNNEYLYGTVNDFEMMINSEFQMSNDYSNYKLDFEKVNIDNLELNYGKYSYSLYESKLSEDIKIQLVVDDSNNKIVQIRENFAHFSNDEKTSLSGYILGVMIRNIYNIYDSNEIDELITDLGFENMEFGMNNTYILENNIHRLRLDALNVIYSITVNNVKENDFFKLDNTAINSEEDQEKLGEETNTNQIVYKASTYKIGTDMPSGEYIVFSERNSGYFSISSDSSGNSILSNDNFDYNTIIKVNDGEYLKLSRAYAIPFNEVNSLDISKIGMYKVGKHIEAKEYKLCSTSSSGYYAVYDGPLGKDENIVTNDNFSGCTYITVRDGQYLQLSRATIQE